MIVGISGKAGHGKTTLAQLLVGRFAFATIKSFADPLRSTVKAAYGLSSADFKRPRKDRPHPTWGVSPTTLLQQVGTFFRDLDEDHWVKMMQMRIGDLGDRIVVIDDMRYRNEARWVRSRGGILVRIHRPNHKSGRKDHSSETALDNWSDWDFQITNDTERSDSYVALNLESARLASHIEINMRSRKSLERLREAA